MQIILLGLRKGTLPCQNAILANTMQLCYCPYDPGLEIYVVNFIYVEARIIGIGLERGRPFQLSGYNVAGWIS